MCSMASMILCFTFLNLFVFVQCVSESPVGDSYGIVATEWAIRDTLNNLFSTLKLKVMQKKLKLKLFQGTKSSIKRFPFMASVQFFKKFQCSGSIIKSDLVITSASCLQIAYNNRFFRENPAFLSVQVGSSFCERGGENVAVLEVNFHPNYNPKSLRHNLAIMRLTRKLKFTRKENKIKKINLDKNPWTLPPNTDGIIIVGWGARALGTNVVSLWKNELLYAKLDFYPLAECQEIYTKEFVTDRNFCAGFFSKGGGACNHDAGGPGISTGILVGVISFGAPICGTPDAPTVFTKLGYYTDWIEGIIETQTYQEHQPTTQRTVSFARYGLPSFTKTTPFRVTPIVSKIDKRGLRNDGLTTNDKKHEFKDFLKTMFKKKKQGQEQEDDEQEEDDEREPEDIPKQEEEQDLEDLLGQELGQELENIKKQEAEQEQENGQEQEDLENQQDAEQQEIKQEDVQKQEIEQEHTKDETEEVSESEARDKTQYLKEINKSELKQAARTKPERKPSINKLKSTPQATESESQSNENSVETTSTFEINKAVTSLLGDYDASAQTTTSFKNRNDGNEDTSASQETDFDDAIESLIDDLNLSFILKSKNSSSKDQQQMRARGDIKNYTVLNQFSLNKNTKVEKSRSVVKNKNLNANENQSDADDRSDKENSNEKGETDEDIDEDLVSNLNGDINEQGVYDNKNVKNGINRHSADNVDEHSNDKDKSERVDEVISTVTKDDEKTDDDDDYEVDDGGETDDETETFSIPVEVPNQDSTKNSTEKLLEMLEYEDLYKLLMKDSERLT